MMALTLLDPKTALIVGDLQKGIISRPIVHPVDDVVRNAAALANAFRSHGLPVVLVRVTGGAPGRTEQSRPPREFPEGWADLIPELQQQPEDSVVTKQTWGAFTHTGLEEYLKSQSVTQVVIVGVATGSGVESTARQAYELGFNVTLASDAMTDLNLDAHNHSLTRVFPRLGEIGTTQEIMALLDATG